jgi:uncharacterized integral membrane protein (TIGR00698 family)
MVEHRDANSRRWPGLLVTAALAAIGTALAALPAVQGLGLSALTLTILCGIVAGNTIFPRLAAHAAPGVDFSKGTLLRAGIVLYGFRITFQQIAAVGWPGLLIDAVMVGSTFTLATLLGTRLFRLDRQTSMLIGAGSAICGAAAVLAAEPVVRAQAHKVSVAVATVVIFGTIAMFVYPLLFPHLGLSPQQFGIFAGSTIHEVAQVIAAGKTVSESVAATAVIEKMLRVMMLAPFLLVLSATECGGAARMEGAGHTRRAHFRIPWFALLFIGVSAINSLQLLPGPWVTRINAVDGALLAMAMAGLGLRTHVGAIRQAGVKPLLLGGTLFVFLMSAGYALNRGVALLFR